MKPQKPSDDIQRKSQLVLQQKSYYNYSASKRDIGAFKVSLGVHSQSVVSAVQSSIWCYQLENNFFFYLEDSIVLLSGYSYVFI